MSDFIIVDGDMVMFQPTFSPAIVVPQPGIIKGSGKCNGVKRKVCVVGDEGQVQVPGCPYISGPFSIPGVGTIKIQALAGNQQASKTKSGDKKVILKGQFFEAIFEVMTPAMMPPPVSTADSMKKYPGKGMFINSNMTIKAT